MKLGHCGAVGVSRSAGVLSLGDGGLSGCWVEGLAAFASPDCMAKPPEAFENYVSVSQHLWRSLLTAVQLGPHAPGLGSPLTFRIQRGLKNAPGCGALLEPLIVGKWNDDIVNLSVIGMEMAVISQIVLACHRPPHG